MRRETTTTESHQRSKRTIDGNDVDDIERFVAIARLPRASVRPFVIDILALA